MCMISHMSSTFRLLQTVGSLCSVTPPCDPGFAICCYAKAPQSPTHVDTSISLYIYIYIYIYIYDIVRIYIYTHLYTHGCIYYSYIYIYI